MFKKTLCCSLFALFTFSLLSGKDMNENSPDGYYLIWQDNFDAPVLNKDHWLIETDGKGNGNDEMQYYREENISIGKEPVSGESCLIITARKEDFSGKKFTSGRIITLGKVAVKYGKVEARIKIPPTANGLWPAFWMMGTDYHETGWPGCGEIDIMEVGAKIGIETATQDSYFNGACHWGKYRNGGHPNYSVSSNAPYSLHEDFHLFTLVWDKEAIKMYLDMDKYPGREPYYELSINSYENENSPGNYFHKKCFILFNLAVGGHFTGIVGDANIEKITGLNAGNNYEAAMYVDYIRIYQKGEAGEEYFGPSVNHGDEKEMLFTLYPNPATGFLHIDGNETPVRVSMYSLTGNKVMEFYNVSSIDILQADPGNCILYIETKDGIVEVHHLNKN